MDSQSFNQTRIIYILYIIGAFFWPVMLVGVILAYVEKGKAVESIIVSHLSKQIRVFWIYLLCGVVGGIVLGIFLLGTLFSVALDQNSGAAIGTVLFAILFVFLFAVALLAYVLVSCIRGLSALDKGKSVL